MNTKWIEKRIEQTLKSAIQNNELSGANILVFHEGAEVCYLQQGFADVESKIPIQRDTIFRLYSMTKPVTATAVMLLFERGLLDLFDPVSRYLSGFQNQKVDEGSGRVPPHRELLIRDLLNMTSGLLYPGEGPAGEAVAGLYEELDQRLYSEAPMTTKEMVLRLAETPLAFHPGEKWAYGTSADLLGALVEAVSGVFFGEFLSRELFQPLGMRDTAFFVPPEKLNRLASAYETVGGKFLKKYTGSHLGIGNRMDHSPAFESGGAGLFSTIDDYLRFSRMLMNKGKRGDREILKAKTVEFLTTSILDRAQMEHFSQWTVLSGYSYGNLMRIMVQPEKAGVLTCRGEYGWNGWLGCHFANYPKEKLTILVMMQKKDTGSTPLVHRLKNIIISAL